MYTKILHKRKSLRIGWRCVVDFMIPYNNHVYVKLIVFSQALYTKLDPYCTKHMGPTPITRVNRVYIGGLYLNLNIYGSFSHQMFVYEIVGVYTFHKLFILHRFFHFM